MDGNAAALDRLGSQLLVRRSFEDVGHLQQENHPFVVFVNKEWGEMNGMNETNGMK